MRKKGVLIWLGVLVVLVGLTVWYGAVNFIVCWDGMDVDEELLMENCGITRDEFFAADDIYETCPEAMDAVTMIGGCETDWYSVGWGALVVGVVYLIFSGVGYGVVRLVRGKR